jgi:PAS domain S-box-containing protein
LNATTDAVMLLDLEGVILDINAAYADKFGRQADEIIGLCLWDLIPSDVRNIKENIDRVIATNKSIRFEEEYRAVWADNIVYPVSDMQGNVSRVAIFSHDITARKQAEETLRRHRDHLEELVKERTVNLEQTNTALKVLLKRRAEDRIELEERMVLNVKELVLPFMDELKNSRLNDEQKALAEVMEYNLNDIVSPFVKALSSKYYNLTPTEIQIANLIKQGKSSKELAEQLKMSPRTIDIHRYHIRKKLGINNKKTNLRTHLLSIN